MQAPTTKNGVLGIPGTMPIVNIAAPPHADRSVLAGELLADVAAEVVGAGGPGDDEARRDRDQQRGDLRHQAVADGQQAVGVDRVADGLVPRWSTPMSEAADEVDSGDDDARRSRRP